MPPSPPLVPFAPKAATHSALPDEGMNPLVQTLPLNVSQYGCAGRQSPFDVQASARSTRSAQVPAEQRSASRHGLLMSQVCPDAIRGVHCRGAPVQYCPVGQTSPGLLQPAFALADFCGAHVMNPESQI